MSSMSQVPSSSSASASEEAQRASRGGADGVTSSITSPSACFVHSYLDGAVGAVRKQYQQQQQQQRRSHSRDEAAKRKSRDLVDSSGDASTPRESTRATPASYFAESHRGTDSTSQEEQTNLLDEEDATASSDGTVSDGGREHRSRPPTHRGPRGAAEPDSDHEEGYSSSGSYESGYSSQSEDDRVRSLTRQLAETAVGVREMSKQLGRARVKSTIQSVLIITKARDNHLITLTRELAIWLMTTPRNGRDTGLVVYVDSQLRTSKRFDAEGIKRDHPKLFHPALRHTHSRRASQNGYAATSDGVERPASASSSSSSSGVPHGNGKDEGQLRYWTSDMCSRSPHLFDFVVTLGGDGTVLFCSWLFQRIVPPVMPFALGSLGFLTNFDFAHYADVIQSALDNGIRVNLRMRFTATVYRATLPTSTDADRKRRRAIKSGKTGEIIMRTIADGGWDRIERPLPEKGDLRGHFTEEKGTDSTSPRPAPSEDAEAAAAAKRKDKEVMCFSTRPVETFEVLNDLVVDRGPSPYVSLLEVFGDEHHMTTAQADGLCISTPTGSTAYSLSAGGSLVHPEIPAILISPICPHTLSFRPMLLPDSMELRIAVPYNSRSTAWASFDGRGRVELKQGDHIKVTASRYPFPTVCAENQSIDWFDSISRTLKWNERQRQKSFVVVEEGEESHSGRRNKKSLAGASSGESGKTAEPPSSSTPVKHADDALCVDLDDDDEEETEETEAFDIDDSSTAPTRAATPDPPNMANGGSKHHSRAHSLRRRASASGTGRRSHSRGDVHSHSLPGSHRSSHEALPRLGLTPLTPANATQRGFEASSQLHPPNSAKSVHSHARDDSHNSLLDSPDRFGLAGPPLPPRALSERHLAHADFRLDDASSSGAASADAQRHSPAQLSASDLQSKARRIAQSETLHGDSLSHAVHVLQGATDAITPQTSPQQGQQRARSSRVRDMRAQAGQMDTATPRGRRGSAGTTTGGGTALIVYGEDDSDSDEISADQ